MKLNTLNVQDKLQVLEKFNATIRKDVLLSTLVSEKEKLKVEHSKLRNYLLI